MLISAETFLPSINGVTNSVLRVVQHLDARGHEVRIVAPGPGADHIELPSGNTVVIERVRGRNVPMYDSLTFGIGAIRTLRRSIRGFRPDVVHLAAPVVLGKRVGRVARRLGVPVVALFQTDLGGFVSDYGFSAAARPVWSFLRRIHNRADLTLAPTPKLADELRLRSFERVDVWGRGVDHKQFEPSRRSWAFRKAAGADDDTVVVGYVGRLASEKRIDRLNAIEGLPNVQLVVVGDGPERQRLQRMLPNAHFTGFLSGDALGEAMASLDVFVHTGEHETFCQTVQEAMSCNLPVVAPASGGPLDLVTPGVTGYLYPPDQTEVLRRSVERLAADPELRASMGAAGRVAVAERSWAAVGDELLDRYDMVLESRARDGLVHAA